MAVWSGVCSITNNDKPKNDQKYILEIVCKCNLRKFNSQEDLVSVPRIEKFKITKSRQINKREKIWLAQVWFSVLSAISDNKSSLLSGVLVLSLTRCPPVVLYLTNPSWFELNVIYSAVCASINAAHDSSRWLYVQEKTTSLLHLNFGWKLFCPDDTMMIIGLLILLRQLT